MIFSGTLFATLVISAGLACAAPNSGNHAGSATLYHPAVGACGVHNTDADPVAAVSQEIFDSFGHTSNPNDSPVCGRWIVVNGPDGSEVRARIEDKCGGCATNSILLSPAAFKELADPAVGVIPEVDWLFFLK